VYVHFGPHGTACLTTDGEIVWTTQKLQYGPRHGTGASPALTGDILVIPCDGWDVQYVAGLDRETGEIRWKTDRDTQPVKGFSFSTPLIIEAGGRTQAVCPGSDAVFAYDPASGNELWRVRYGDGYSVVPRPLFAHGLVYVCTGYNQPQLLAIDPTGSGDVTDSHVQWRVRRAVPHNPSPIVVGNELYFVSDQGVATCVDALTGEQHWQERLGGNFSASPVAADGKVYFQDENGTAVVIETGPEYRELARNSWGSGGRTFASYAVLDGALIIRSETHLYRVDSATSTTGG
jgi:outer membrane protein assembly factor BamB